MNPNPPLKLWATIVCAVAMAAAGAAVVWSGIEIYKTWVDWHTDNSGDAVRGWTPLFAPFVMAIQIVVGLICLGMLAVWAIVLKTRAKEPWIIACIASAIVLLLVTLAPLFNVTAKYTGLMGNIGPALPVAVVVALVVCLRAKIHAT